MPDDIAWLDIVALDDVLQQFCQQFDLLFGIGVPDSPGRGLIETRVDHLNTNGAGIEPGTTPPLAFPRMPGTAAFIYQLVDLRWVIANQVVGTDFTMGEQLQRTVLGSV
ncbi:hypothetical protein D3C86_1563890 [compost metagenome]